MTVEVPEEAVVIDQERARAHAEQIRTLITEHADVEQRLAQALETALREDHREALGYATWDDYFNQELRPTVEQMRKDDRRAMITSLYDQGLSQRMVAAITGVSQSTVARETRQVSQGDSSAKPATGTKGRDDKTYRRSPRQPRGRATHTDIEKEVNRQAERGEVSPSAVISALQDKGFAVGPKSVDKALYVMRHQGKLPEPAVTGLAMAGTSERRPSVTDQQLAGEIEQLTEQHGGWPGTMPIQQAMRAKGYSVTQAQITRVAARLQRQKKKGLPPTISDADSEVPAESGLPELTGGEQPEPTVTRLSVERLTGAWGKSHGNLDLAVHSLQTMDKIAVSVRKVQARDNALIIQMDNGQTFRFTGTEITEGE